MTLAQDYDLILRGGTIYDGSGGKPFVADLALKSERIAAIGDLKNARAAAVLNVQGLAVAPGFINMLSHSQIALLVDGRSQGEIRQGVTLEVMGEGTSMGPLNDAMKAEMRQMQGDVKYEIEWTTLGEFLTHLEKRGVSCNVASFIGAATPRIHVIGKANRAPTPAELDQMQALVRAAMEEGAMGVASSLIYAPAFYAKTDELIALCRAAAPYGGRYISHIRSEGNRLLEALDELITIAREADIPAEVYHLKAAGEANWPKLDAAIRKLENARKAGLSITADMYTYPAASTGLDAAMPPWVQAGGYLAWAGRLRDPEIRENVRRQMSTPSDDWENALLLSGSAEKVLLVAFKNPALKPLTGKTLAEVARMRGKSPEDTAIDLVIEDGSRVQVVYFWMSEDNVRKQIALPWVAFGSDSASQAPEGVFLKSSVHPRAYGTFARLLAKYVRDEHVIPLEEAIRRLTLFPAENLKIKERGALRAGFFADVVVFDPSKIQDHATYEKPQQYATGMVHVFVNGVQVLKDGEHTGAKPGRFVRGPGWKPAATASAGTQQ
ncbi:MAG: D-aminoacylase [Opitutaceae bacterium]|nr:D-aminoacylase [Opitutaceae bacterium]